MSRSTGIKLVERKKTDDQRDDLCKEKCLMRKKKSRRGRPYLRWLDSIKRHTKKAEVEDKDWRILARDGGQCRKVEYKAT